MTESGDESQNNPEKTEDLDERKAANEKRAKQLNRVVCICKGIPLAKVLEGLPGSDTVADVNQKVGTGSGGCQGERCGPRIKTLLRKFKEKDKAK